MKTRVINWISRYNMLHDGDTIVVGVSGGADSVCLLFLLCEIAVLKIYDISIEVVHVNHEIRSNASRDSMFVEELCKKWEAEYRIPIKCHIVSKNVHAIAIEEGLSVEEAGRLVRYEAMRDVLGDKKGAIAVAHHANDRAETMMFNLMRGTGLKGMSGIQPVNGDIIRPLLCVDRESIEEFLRENDIEHVTDETNFTDDYTRNKIRHHIIEYAKDNICPGIIGNMNNAAEQFMMAEEYISEYTLKASLKTIQLKEYGKVVLNISELVKEHEYIIDRVLYEAFSYVANKKRDITSEHIRGMRLLLTANGSKEISLPYNIIARKEYSSLYIMKREDIPINDEYSFNVDMNVLSDFDPDAFPRDAYTKWFDYDKITSVAVVRTRQEKDYLVINNMNQKKLLKDYFINEKVPKNVRDEIPLLCDENHVMWIIGMRISEYYKVSQDTKRVLEVKYSKQG